MGRAGRAIVRLAVPALVAALVALVAPAAPVAADPAPGEGAVPRTAVVAGPLAGIVVGASRCSAGFVVRSPGGTPRLLTAGHCTRTGGVARSGESGRPLGEVRTSRYGPGGDWGVLDLAVPPAALAAVAGGAAPGPPAPTGPGDPLAVGTPVCRSGATTGRQCGVVVARDVTANYGAGPIGGLVAISACSEPGDSGGPVTAGDRAAGLLSGGTGDCAAGGVSLVQPLAPVLAREGLELVSP